MSDQKASIIRDIFGNPWRPARLPPGPVCLKCGGTGTVNIGMAEGMCDCLPVVVEPGYRRGSGFGPCHWLTAQVLSLATAAYSERDDDGDLDRFRLCLVADALEDAGCTAVRVLDHLRSPGKKYRGMWSLDLILGKE